MQLKIYRNLKNKFLKPKSFLKFLEIQMVSIKCLKFKKLNYYTCCNKNHDVKKSIQRKYFYFLFYLYQPYKYVSI